MGELIYLPLRNEGWLTEEQLAQHFNVSARTVRRWKASGCPSRKFGSVRRYRLSEVTAWHDKEAHEHPVA